MYIYIVPIDFPIQFLQFSILSKSVFFAELLSDAKGNALTWTRPPLSLFGRSRPAGRPTFFVFFCFFHRMFLEGVHRSRPAEKAPQGFYRQLNFQVPFADESGNIYILPIDFATQFLHLSILSKRVCMHQTL